MIKTTLREIKQSLGRFMAIFLIVALGVGFFSGLKVTDQAMRETADRYFTERKMYDYQLLSTLGFDEDTVSELKKQEEVESVEGEKSLDVIVVDDSEEERTWRTYSLPQEINLPEIIEGRFPETGEECVVDSKSYKEDVIGKTIRISENNEEDTLDSLRYRELTVTGIVRSPLYSYYERGNTSVGDGSIDAFAYFSEDAFDMDYHTAIYVRFSDSADYKIYSEEYNDRIEERTPSWEKVTAQLATARFDRIYQEANQELQDAREEFDREIGKAQKKLDNAKKDLKEGFQEVEDGEKKLADAKDEILSSEKTIKEKEEELKKGQKEYEKGKKKYDSGYKEYEKGRKEYQNGLKQYEDAKADFDQKSAAYYSGLKEYEKGASSLKKSKEDYQIAKEQFDAGKDYMTEEERIATETQLASWKEVLEQSEAELEASKKVLDASSTQIKMGEAQFKSQKAKLDQAKTKLDGAKKTLDTAKNQLTRAKKQLEDGKKQLEDGKKKIEEGKEEIEDNEKKLADARVELEDGQKEYEENYQKFLDEKAEGEEKLADAQAEVDDIEEPETYVLDRSSNNGYSNFENDSKIVKSVAKVFPVFFFLLAALICMTTMTRMVEEQRMQIGTFKALGYSDGAILFKYLFYAGLAAMSGAVLGFLVFSVMFPQVIWIAYGMMYNMCSMGFAFNPSILLISMVVAAACSMGATYLAVRQELKDNAATLMRPKSPKSGQRVFLENIPFLWNRLRFLDKVSVRNLFRYKKRFFMMIIGISGCTALIVTGFGIRDSITTIAEHQFGEIFVYDMVAVLKEEQSLQEIDKELSDAIENVDGVIDHTAIRGEGVDVLTSKKTKSVNLLVPSDMDQLDKYIHLQTEDKVAVKAPDKGEAVISAKLAHNYGIKIGDTIKIQNDEHKGGDVVVTGIFENYFMHYAIISPETYRDIFHKKALYNQLFVNTDESLEIHQISADIMKDDAITATSINLDLREKVANMMSSMNYVVIMIITCAGLLAFVVIYNLNNINITERIREIATIKVLGFYQNETKSYIFRENIVLTIIGGIIGLFLGNCLHKFVLSQINIDAISFQQQIRWYSYAIGMVLTIFFNWLVNLFMTGKLDKIDMAESLKSVE